MQLSAYNISPIKSQWESSRCSRAAKSADPCPILLNFKPIRDFIAVFVTCKNVDEPIKNEGAIVLTTLYIDFSDAQGQRNQ